jgi:hypothetical protein
MTIFFFLEIFKLSAKMSSTEPPGDQSEAAECYKEQRRLEEELLAADQGEEEGGEGNVNPDILDVSMEEPGAGAGANPTVGAKANPNKGAKVLAVSAESNRQVTGSQSDNTAKGNGLGGGGGG